MGEGYATPTGVAVFEIHKRRSWLPQDLDAKLRAYRPKTHFGDIVRACFGYLPRDLALELLDEMKILLIGESSLAVQVLRVNGEHEYWGVVSHKVITDAAVAVFIDALQGMASINTWNYHGAGTGTNAEQASDSTLQTELTTQYVVNNTRPTGLVSEPAVNQYRTQATITVDASVTIQEHGVFSQAATSGGILLDRSLTGGQALASGDGLLATYMFQLASGG